MKTTLQIIYISLLLVVSNSFLLGQTIYIGTGGDFMNLSAAQSSISPGDTIVIKNQIFNDGAQFLYNVNGSASNPVVIIAETQHNPIFQGGSEAIHLVNCNYLEINGLVFEQQTSNGINIDDGGDYSTPSTNITIRNCIFRDIVGTGNIDFLKMAGVDDFIIENCSFTNGSEGSGIDFVGCHNGIVQDNSIDDAGISGIQVKGGSQFITIRRNLIKNISQRGMNLGGSTGAPYFRPPLPQNITDAFEAADIDVYSNVFINNKAPIAYVGSVRVRVINNTLFKPWNWVFRILQETTTEGFLPCSNNEFKNNIIYLENDLTEVNIGSNTESSTFEISNNLWFNESSSGWSPTLPVQETNQIISDPLFLDATNNNFSLESNSPAIGAGLNLTSPTLDFNNVSFNEPRSIGAIEGNPSTVYVDQIDDEEKIHIYPNPFTDEIFIKSDINSTFDRIIIQDSKGKTIYEESITSPLSKVKIDEAAGIYFVELSSQNKSKKFKLIKH